MKKQEALNFRDQFRQARALALRDAEAFDEIIFVVERMGMFLTHRVDTLKGYQTIIEGEARRSPLAYDVPGKLADLHIPFTELFDLVKDGRNWAMHQGAVARHLTNHVTKLAIVLEDALMSDCDKVRDFMVENPVCAEMWQPLSFIRQRMLESSFSFLPVNATPEAAPTWKLVSDLEVARYLRAGMPGDRKLRLAEALRLAEKPHGIQLRDTKKCGPEDLISNLFKKCDSQQDWVGLPILVVPSGSADLLGILTPFDLL